MYWGGASTVASTTLILVMHVVHVAVVFIVTTIQMADGAHV